MAGNDAIQAVGSNDYGANKAGKTGFNVLDYFQIAQQKDQERLQKIFQGTASKARGIRSER